MWFPWRRRRAGQEAVPGVKRLTGAVLDRELRVHQKAHVEAGDRLYFCRVHDFDSSQIRFTAPLDTQGLPVLLGVGRHIDVVLPTRVGLLGFAARVQATEVIDGVPLFSVARPEGTQLTDRRSYYRVPTELPMQYRLRSNQAWRQGQIVNISGGGALCQLSPDEMALRETGMLELLFQLPMTARPLQVKARVCYVSEPQRGTELLAACEFQNLPGATRELIIRYVAERQQELIRAGTL